MRSELFSAEQMEQHGRDLAGFHILDSQRAPGHPLLDRLAENEVILLEVRKLVTESVKANRQITPAGEWLLDNFYLIEEHIHTGKRHFSKGYSRELPHLLNGPSKGLPRVYDIALETIAHGDGRVDPENLTRFVKAYEAVVPLKLGELWAIPIMLRLALIENLRRVGVRIATSSIDRDLAGSWADKMMEIAEKDPKNLILIIADMARSDPPMTTAFVSEFVRRLQGQSPALAFPLTWIEQHLAESGFSIERLVQLGSQQLAADQLTISNSINSLRFLGIMDWKEFVETMSIVEQTLFQDPAGAYSKMDFATRDRYRHIIEKLARHSRYSEIEVTRRVIHLAHKGMNTRGAGDRAAHVGYYLIDKGLPQLERLVRGRFSTARALRRVRGRLHFLLYTGSIILLTLIFSGALLTKAWVDGVHGWQIILLGILLLLCTAQLAVTLVNWMATLFTSPKFLPRMDFSEGIPPESRTLVAVPTLLMNQRQVGVLAEALEVRFLANQDDNLHFCLLTDFIDAAQETMPEDEQLVSLASQKIEELNEKYPGANGDTFFLFHRPRKWNPGERVWMGYERKRGKLEALNSFLLNKTADQFSLITGNTDVLVDVKYVITLDTDTKLPRNVARQFVGAMAHPLNRVGYDEKKQRVSEGYGILQPRVAIDMPCTNLSRYAKLFGSDPGIDPYTRVVSDVYQDLFREGSYIGKGIYDVGIFNRVFTGRLPDNQILSHDLLEGCYVRSGLLSDVLLYEDYPYRYIDDVARRRRWIRGDWQIIPWLLPWVPCANGKYQKNPLSILSRWKIFDNLRRSVTSLALTILLLLGWFVLPDAWFWTLSVIAIILLTPVIVFVLDIFHKPAEILPKQHLNAVLRSTRTRFAQASFTFVCLPYEAFFSLDAIVHVVWRMLVTHRRLLEWNPYGCENRKRRTNIIGAYLTMWIAPVIALSSLIWLSVYSPLTLALIWPIPCIWILSPFISWWASRISVPHKARLSTDQFIFLHKLSRKTWAYFDTLVGPEDHWLPPDNYQEHPTAVIAHRTSPTNIGLALLSTLSACDFGYLSAGQLLERIANTFRTMELLERYRGHFYNWYDTRSLQPLHPLYISSVDSGNLAGYLLVLRSGLLDLPNQKMLGPHLFEGIRDTLSVLRDVLEGKLPDSLSGFRKELKSIISAPPATLPAVRLCLERLATYAGVTAEGFTDPGSQAAVWSQALTHQCRNALNELRLLTPWIFTDSAESQAEFPGMDGIPTLRELAAIDTDAGSHARERMEAIESLAWQSWNFAQIEYDFLYDKAHHLQVIGYNVDERQRDAGYYDLLASEARFCSFVAIAQGKVPEESWFAMGRLLTATGGNPALLSWSGSMFEYLMPLLVMPTYENTLLDQTYKSAVDRQIDYGRQRGVPWGMSESGYNMVDVNLNYQYRAFGVPGLGLKRGLGEDLVIAPYAAVLALMVMPEETCRNLERLAGEKMIGQFGFYEAIDYTPSRVPRGESSAIVQSFMAHHQGMSLLSLSYLLLDHPMQKRFEADPQFRSTLLLLQERIPKATVFFSRSAETPDVYLGAISPKMPMRVINTPDTPTPEVHLMSNGNYHVMVSNAGGGYSMWKNYAITRWREDTTLDNRGMFCYIRDLESGEFWSAAYQPTLRMPEIYEAIFSKGRAEFRRRDHDFDTHTEIIVSTEDDIELRRVRITNRSRSRKEIDVTSYAEVVLASPATDAIHPAFSNLFVQTEIIDERQAIICHRRPRSPDEKEPWLLHLMTTHGAYSGKISYETDRLKFTGRDNTTAAPQAMNDYAPLSGTQGPVLDPIVAIRYHLIIEPEESVKIDMVTGIGETREAVLRLIDKYQDRRLTNRVFELAWTHVEVLLRQINATEADAQLFGRLASSIIYANSSLRTDPGVIFKNHRRQSGLWGYSISGDLPIVLLQIEDSANINLVRQLVQAHAYWHLKGLAVDLVIWNEDRDIYRQTLHDQILGIIAAGIETNVTDRPGGIFLRVASQISEEDRILIRSVARIVISDRRGTLAEQVTRRCFTEPPVSPFRPTRSLRSYPPAKTPVLPKLAFFNGIGGFTPDGQEYIITISNGQVTPAPWVNIIANPHFGSMIPESGLAFTWFENAHELRLTPWNNDPLSDTGGEACYIRDEETGHFWSPTPLPARGINPYVCRHGFGYSVFEHTEDGISSELWTYVAPNAAVKFTVLKLRNESGRPRRLSATAYAEWVLGDLRPKTAMHITSVINPANGALYLRNPYSLEFADRVAFFQTDDLDYTFTCDRTEFIGRNGTLRDPAAMRRAHLSGKTGAALDPCSAIQVPFDLPDGQEHEIIFRLGAGQNVGDADTLVRRFSGPVTARNTLESVRQFWKHTLSAIQVETPDASLDIMANGWLMYQTLACRIWARNGYYQSGGAFGFRDQLQDVMALIHTSPQLVRAHLLLCASRQFTEGDVQHWWHPPSGRGVRSHCSDDYLWLPLATSRYILGTGDMTVLDESVSFLEGRPVNPADDSYYDLPSQSDEYASLYQHCVRAILKGLRFGEHGLPFIGTGDWNDGMNTVGNQGKGESVWLGFFLYDVLMQFSKVAHTYGDLVFEQRCQKEAAFISQNLEQNGWDGKWYLRAWFDNGSPLGSALNPECQIDSISQSWSVLSGAGDKERSTLAMESVYKRLVRRDNELIQLLDPPFDKSAMNPGYIKGYIPGVRENGGQYTHAAIWAAMAFARLGDSARAWELTTMINPVNHTLSPEGVTTYKVEPYVMAADIYSLSPHTGQGGWTWYTGSAGWMYRLITESLLGLRLETDKLYIEPCLPSAWESYKIHYRYWETTYHITIHQTPGSDRNIRITLDSIEIPDDALPLVNDRKEHEVEVKIATTNGPVKLYP